MPVDAIEKLGAIETVDYSRAIGLRRPLRRKKLYHICQGILEEYTRMNLNPACGEDADASIGSHMVCDSHPQSHSEAKSRMRDEE